MRALRLTAGAIALAAFIAPAAQAQDTAEVRRLTILSFSEPVQLPGRTLPAGKYRFEMADVNNAAHTVRVLSEDGKTVIGTFHTIPSTQPQRDLRNQDSLVMFSERPRGPASGGTRVVLSGPEHRRRVRVPESAGADPREGEQHQRRG